MPKTREVADVYLEIFFRSISNTSLHLHILPTEQCNFRCTYCYEDFAIGRMSGDVLQGLKRYLDRRIPELAELKISWFGGEPLVAKDIVFEISEYIHNAVRGRGSLRYSADMTTNGYRLTPDVLARLVCLGVRTYQISLDGPKDRHDKTRKMVGGQGTFDRIWGNLLAYRRSDLDFRIIIRIHLTPSNLRDMDDFLATIRDTFLSDHRFSVFLKPIARLGGMNDTSMQVIPDDLVPDVMVKLETILYGRPIDPGTREPYVCYAAKPDSFVIRANGTINKCTVILDDARNHIGRLLPDGQFELDNTRLGAWNRGWKSLDPAVLTCPLTALTASLDSAQGNSG